MLDYNIFWSCEEFLESYFVMNEFISDFLELFEGHFLVGFQYLHVEIIQHFFILLFLWGQVKERSQDQLMGISLWGLNDQVEEVSKSD